MKKFTVNCLVSRLAVMALLIGAISLLSISTSHTAQAQTLPCNPDDTKADVTVTHCLVVLVRDEDGYPIANLHLKFLSQIYKVQPSQDIADLGEAVTNSDGKAAIDVTGWPLNDVYSLGLAEPFPSPIQQNSKLLPNRQLRGQDLMWPDFGLRGIPNQNENMVKFVLISTSQGGWFTLDTSYAGFALPHPNSTGPDGSDTSGGGGNADPGKGVITGTAYISISQYQATLAAQTVVVARAQTAVAQMTPLNGGSGSNNGSGNSLTPRNDRVGAGTPTPTYLPGYTPGLYNNYKQVPSNSATVTNPTTATTTTTANTDSNATAAVTTIANGNTPVAITPTPFYRVATTPIAVAGLADTTAVSGLISSNGVVASNNNGSDANNSTNTTAATSNNTNNGSNDQPLYVTILEAVVALLLIVTLLSWGKLAKWLRRNSK